jgi:uncharacterized protein
VDVGVLRDAGDRLQVLDQIRGFALCGILFANVLWFNGFQELTISDRSRMLVSDADHAVLLLIRVFVNAKFYHILAFLFGLGFALRLERGGEAAAMIFPRRMALLLMLGVAHSLLWWGDILRYYALIGLTLLWFRRLGNRQLIVWIIVCSALPVLSEPLKMLMGVSPQAVLLAGIAPSDWFAVVTQAGLVESIQLNLARIGDHFVATVLDGRIFRILAMFLAGLLAGRLSVFSEPERHETWIRRVLWPSFVVGIVGNLLFASLYYERWGLDRSAVAWLRDAISLFATPALSLFFISAQLHLFVHTQAWSRLNRMLQWLAPAGRMALTNYLTQSLIAISIFSPALGGQYAQLSISDSALLALLVLSVQVVFSHWWLQRFRAGPVEWLWQRGTHAQLRPLRR